MSFLTGWLCRSKWGFAVFYVISLAALIHTVITGNIRDASFLSIESSRVLAYLMLGGWLVFGICVLVSEYKNRGISCLAALQLLVAVYVVQTIGYIAYFHRVPAMLLIPGAVMLALAVLAVGNRLAGRFLQAQCTTCQKDAHFLLTSDRPDQHGPGRRYCFEHFISAMQESLRTYEGRFIIVDRPSRSDSGDGMYFFYDPSDMEIDSYSPDDIQAVENLLKLLLDSADRQTQDVRAVRIPSDAVREIGVVDDSPMFTRDLNTIHVSSLSTDEFARYLEETLVSFDARGKDFSMNEPYAPRGIYIWHNYT